MGDAPQTQDGYGHARLQIWSRQHGRGGWRLIQHERAGRRQEQTSEARQWQPEEDHGTRHGSDRGWQEIRQTYSRQIHRDDCHWRSDVWNGWRQGQAQCQPFLLYHFRWLEVIYQLLQTCERTYTSIKPKEVGKVLSWVHIAISNAKWLLLDIYHDIRPEYLQNFLNEFCWKFNRRIFGDALFDRLMVAAVAYKNQFRYNI